MAYDDLGIDEEADRVAREQPRSKFSDLAPDDPRRQMQEALREHVGCTSPTMFIRRADKAIVSKAAFDMKYNRVVNAIYGRTTEETYKRKLAKYQDHAAQFAIAANGLRIVNGLNYKPGGNEFADGRYNTWQPPAIAPLDESPETFLAHMAYLIPDTDERKLVLDWLAWLVQRPTEKLLFALLIVGAEGTGKSWLGNLMEIILGDSNVTLLEKDTQLFSRFNAWCESKQLVFVHELAPDTKTDLVEAVKGIITERTVHIERKGIDAIKLPNLANLCCITNYPERIKMLRTNRRWAVVRAADDPVGVNVRGDSTAETRAYYGHLFECIGTPEAPGPEARRVLAWLAARDLSGFAGRDLAPATETKEDVAAGDADSITAQVANMRRDQVGPFAYSLLTSAEVMAELVLPPVSRADEYKALLAEVAHALQSVGCRQIRIKAGDGKLRTPQVRVIRGGPQQRLWAVSSQWAKRLEGSSAVELVAAYLAQRDPDALG